MTENQSAHQSIPLLRSNEEQLAKISRQLEGMFRELRLVQDVIMVCGGVRESIGANSAPALFHRSNADHTPFVDVTSTQMATVMPNLTNYSSARQGVLAAIATAGYEVIIPQAGAPTCEYHSPYDASPCSRFGGDYAFKANSLAYLVAETLKGAGSTYASDVVNAVVDTTRKGDYSLFQKKYSAVDVGTGTLTLTPPPDVVAGAGGFPYSLPLTRSYSSSGRVGVWDIALDGSNGGASFASRGYAAPDKFVQGRLGGAWVHNYDIAAEIANDGREALGEHSGLAAAAAIATVYSLYDINKTTDFAHRLTSTFTASWTGGSTITMQSSLPIPIAMAVHSRSTSARPRSITAQWVSSRSRAGLSRLGSRFSSHMRLPGRSSGSPPAAGNPTCAAPASGP